MKEKIKALPIDDRIEIASIVFSKGHSEKFADELDFLDEIRAGIYNENRIKEGFYVAAKLAKTAVLEVLFKE